ncbi:chaperone NapD [Ferrimonas aestuarii]|uniref:Chaperone NapD n=1 Tax=Ferrimonas aestuarii TaxID=2569539 RepID=A0A4U1BH81_9GAMM|nr:chaperone NapD [Ferrimonas aestuarii]TKB50730.1 nitrate reductase [Ferrimonas aestuarii]
MTQKEIHISSVVVQVQPEHLGVVKAQILDLPGAEIHGEDAIGKLVVVLETSTETGVTKAIDAINNLPYVLMTFLVYHQIEPFENLAEDHS